jgi:small subunit ribosomal protein S8
MTDPIADLLTRIRNAGMRRIETIVVPHSNMKEKIVKILAEEKFVSGYHVETNKENGFKELHIDLRYSDKQFVIQKLTRISKPGIRRYVSYDKIPRVLGGIGICILSTSRGVMTGGEAKKQKVGGELLCIIY